MLRWKWFRVLVFSAALLIIYTLIIAEPLGLNVSLMLNVYLQDKGSWDFNWLLIWEWQEINSMFYFCKWEKKTFKFCNCFCNSSTHPTSHSGGWRILSILSVLWWVSMAVVKSFHLTLHELRAASGLWWLNGKKEVSAQPHCILRDPTGQKLSGWGTSEKRVKSHLSSTSLPSVWWPTKWNHGHVYNDRHYV